MKPTAPSHASEPISRRSQPWLLAVIFFVLGAAVTGIWFRHQETNGGTAGLSITIRNLLGQLPAPVTIRYYSLLPTDSADASLQAFAGRVANLLETMQSASGGKLQIITVDTPADTNVAAASTDGIQAFNLDKGGACFLGLTMANGTNKEVIARLQPEWEPALQYDLARAIGRVAVVPPPPAPAPEIAKPSPEIISSIQRLIPDANATSVADANRIFHDDYLNQCAAAGQELEAQIKAASDEVSRAQSGGSAVDVEAARKRLLEVQLAQGEKLKELAARLQTELAVFQQMKGGATNR